MEKIIRYRAWDGIMFENEEECIEWEWKTTHEPHSICFRDKDFVPYNPKSYTEVDRAIEEAEYIEIANIDGWEKDLDWLIEYWGFCDRGIECTGTFEWDWDNAEWFEVRQPDLKPIEKRGD